MIPVSVLILTKNSEKYLSRVLDSVKDFQDVVVYDSGSTDKTQDICVEKNKITQNIRFVVDKDWKGFGIQRQKSCEMALCEWVLWLDSDEILSADLAKEIAALDFTQKQKAYRLKRANVFAGKRITTTDWAHDIVVRLFNTSVIRFDAAPVHESIDILSDCEFILLEKTLDHYPYESVSDFLNKTNRYSDLAVEGILKKKKEKGVWSAFAHGLWSFLRNYFLRNGWRDGFEGFVISYMNGVASTVKYLKAIEAKENKNRKLL